MQNKSLSKFSIKHIVFYFLAGMIDFAQLFITIATLAFIFNPLTGILATVSIALGSVSDYLFSTDFNLAQKFILTVSFPSILSMFFYLFVLFSTALSKTENKFFPLFILTIGLLIEIIPGVNGVFFAWTGVMVWMIRMKRITG